mmetsp:Transcript_15908/g.21598  ORF Transcript_15908/g.21598 Transcript_15908/m.21598 type:complete len:166 (+) Transcript_15908:707-1204(+)
MWTITSNKTLDEPLLALRLEDANGNSEAHFGAIDESSYTGEIYPYDLATSQFWGVEFNSSWIGDSLTSHSSCTQAAIASGTSYIYMPEYDWTNFTAAIMNVEGTEVNGTNTITCDHMMCMASQECPFYYDLLPNFTIGLGQWNYTIPAEGYLIPSTNSSYPCMFV